MTDAISIILPVPPGVNRTKMPVRTRGGARIASTPEYRDWKAMAKREVEAQRGGQRIAGQFRIAMLIPEDNHDSDAFIKALLDACQAGGAIGNDKHCRGGTWDLDDTRQGTALVELTPVRATSAGGRLA